MRTQLLSTLALGAVAALAACGGKATPPTMLPTTGDTGGALAPPPDVKTPPAPTDPAPKTEGAITEAWAHGVHILVKRIPGAETTATSLYIRGGVRNWTAADAGIEQLALATSVDGGTDNLAKDAFTQRLSELGSTLGARSSEDYAALDAWSLTPTWDDTFKLLAAAFLHPALPAEQIEVERQLQLAALNQEQDDPDAKLSRAMYDTVYRGHPYGNRARGTLASVKALTAAQLRAHLDQLRESSRMLLVVVGDIDAQHVIAATTAAFGELPRGAYSDPPLPPWAPDKGAVTTIEQKLPTNYVMAVAPGPRWGDPDFYAMWIGMSALHAREFAEVRTKRNLSYAPSAYMRINTSIPMVGLYVTAVDPVTTMGVMLGEAKRLRDEPIPAGELAAAKAKFLTSTMMAAEDASGQAANLAIAQIVGGDWHRLQDLPTQVHAVTAAQIQGWAGKHLTHLQTIVLGDPTKLDRKALESF